MLLGSFKEILRVFKEGIKCVSRELKVSRMNQESLNEVSIAISLQESHRSYPSRRRA